MFTDGFLTKIITIQLGALKGYAWVLLKTTQGNVSWPAARTTGAHLLSPAGAAAMPLSGAGPIKACKKHEHQNEILLLHKES